LIAVERQMRLSEATDVEEHKAYRGLIGLALGNIVCAAILVAAREVLRKYQSSYGLDGYFGNVQMIGFATTSGQVLAWAIISALIPQRRFLGLLWSAAFAVALGMINWLGFVVHDPTSAVATVSTVWAGCVSLAVLPIAQGLRFLLGWRLDVHGERPAIRGGHFGIADLIEWTVSIGVYLGFLHLCGGFHNLSLLCRVVVWQALVSLPVALSIMSRRRPQWAWFSAAVSTALATTAILEFVNGAFDASWWRFLKYVLVLATSYVAATAVNFVVIRSLGFRLTTQRRQACSSVACAFERSCEASLNSRLTAC
jgi:hypothetical protein